MSEWRDIPGYEGIYQVSDDGQVKRLRRQAPHNVGHLRWLAEKLLSPCRASHGYLMVNLHKDGKPRSTCIHRAVAEAFLADSYFPGAHVCHYDGNPDNNHVSNLRWDTPSGNAFDKVRHGRHHLANRTECINGHEFTPENTRIDIVKGTGKKQRKCRTCELAAGRRQRERLRAQPRRPLAPDDPRHGTATGRNYWRCNCANCRAYGARCDRKYKQKKAQVAS